MVLVAIALDMLALVTEDGRPQPAWLPHPVLVMDILEKVAPFRVPLPFCAEYDIIAFRPVP